MYIFILIILFTYYFIMKFLENIDHLNKIYTEEFYDVVKIKNIDNLTYIISYKWKQLYKLVIFNNLSKNLESWYFQLIQLNSNQFNYKKTKIILQGHKNFISNENFFQTIIDLI